MSPSSTGRSEDNKRCYEIQKLATQKINQKKRGDEFLNRGSHSFNQTEN
jgi:hypothetical protein